jgi:hypothetical protein
MAIALRQPHKSWYRHFWYAEHSPRRSLVDRVLIFGIVALAFLAGATTLTHRHGGEATANRPIVTQPAR